MASVKRCDCLFVAQRTQGHELGIHVFAQPDHAKVPGLINGFEREWVVECRRERVLEAHPGLCGPGDVTGPQG